jgi:hypothetical protein
MIRMLNVILVCTSIAGLIGVYALKYSVEETAAEKTALERRIDRQESELSLLKADWAYLNQPAHVGPLIARHAEALGLQPINPRQFGSIDDLPMRPVLVKDTTALDSLFQSLEMGFDPIEQLIAAEAL